MLKKLVASLAVMLSALGMPGTGEAAPAASSDPPPPALSVKRGDVLVQESAGRWTALRVLEVDPWPDGSATAHVLSYEAVDAKPTVETLRQARVRLWHAPVDAASFAHGWVLIGHEPPSQEQLGGFIEYLKLTDFPRYVRATGQDAHDLVRRANAHYQRAYALGEQGRREEAIQEYGQAIDLFPLFHEAIDNRAFTAMELGRYQEALRDFEQSLRVFPDGVSAFFSKGECLMRLGHLAAAAAIFEEGASRFPEKRDIFITHLDQVRALQAMK